MNAVKTPFTHRQRQALETQRLIVEAAQTLFLDQGYAATTIEAVASKAGVAGSTVYAIFKNKRGILAALREVWHRTSQAKDLYEKANEEPNPERRLELYAHATRRQWETSAAFITIYTGAAAADPEAAAELQGALLGRRRSVTGWLEGSTGMFRQDMTLEQICAVYLALTRSEVYQELVEVWGWSTDAYETWLAETLKQQLLTPTKP